MSITENGIHILPGDSAVGTWRAAFGDESRTLVVRDSLISGPLSPIADLATWRAVRLQFWSDVYTVFFNECLAKSDMRGEALDLFHNTHRLSESDPVYIWAGTDVADQIFFLFVLALVKRLEIDAAKLRYIPFTNRPDWRLPYYPLAVLNPDDLAAHPEPRSFTSEQLELGEFAWTALTSSEPDALVELAGMQPNSMPFLNNVAVQMLRRYPRRETGLSSVQHCLLGNVHCHGPNATRVIGESLADIWISGGSVGDVYLYHVLRKLSATSRPLFQLSGAASSHRNTEVFLTDFGREVFEGHVSAFPDNPIDEWIGGVHLSSSEGRLWMHEEGQLCKMPGY